MKEPRREPDHLQQTFRGTFFVIGLKLEYWKSKWKLLFGGVLMTSLEGAPFADCQELPSARTFP